MLRLTDIRGDTPLLTSITDFIFNNLKEKGIYIWPNELYKWLYFTNTLLKFKFFFSESYRFFIPQIVSFIKEHH